MAYDAIASALKDRQFDAVRRQLREIGMSVDRDVRIPKTLKTVESEVATLTFICGLHRSGTTLFHDFFAKNYDTAFIQNAKVPEHEGQFLQDVYASDAPFGGPGMFAFYPQMHAEPVTDPARAAEIRKQMADIWLAYSNESKHTHLLEKSPPNLARIPFLRSVFPQARFIIWTRDPRAVTISTQKWHKIPIHTLMQHWNVAYLQAIEALKADCTIVSYEDFCADPAKVTAKAAEFCGIAARPTPLDPKRRFQEIVNGNPKYIDSFPQVYKTRAKLRAWELFGYNF